MNRSEESQWLAALKDPLQKRNAFGQVMSTYQERVYYFTRRMITDHDDASDIVQQVFIKAWKGIDNFRGDSKLSTWLMRIAHRESITFLNKKNRFLGISVDDVHDEIVSNLTADPYYNGDEIQMHLQAAIATLPEKQKTVFVMRYFDDLSYKEIAEISGTSVGGLKANYHHAVQKIEEQLRNIKP